MMVERQLCPAHRLNEHTMHRIRRLYPMFFGAVAMAARGGGIDASTFVAQNQQRFRMPQLQRDRSTCCTTTGMLLFLTGKEEMTPEKNTAAKVRLSTPTFRGTSDSFSFDTLLSWITSDIGSIALGGIGLVLLLADRLLLDNTSMEAIPESRAVVSEITTTTTLYDLGEQTRTNLLAVVAIGAVLFNGLSQLDVQSALAETVQLQGSVVTIPILLYPRREDGISMQPDQLSWTLSALVTATPATTAIVLLRSGAKWQPLAYTGVVHANLCEKEPTVSPTTPIMDRFCNESPWMQEENKYIRLESYLPTLQALPGKTELTNYLLPINTQAALLIPLQLSMSSSSPSSVENAEPPEQAILLLGSNQARSFSPRDIAWCHTVADRLQKVC